MSEWISAEDRLPEDSQRVIVCTRGGDVFDSHHFKRNNFILRGGWGDQTTGVTHWMPLPEPPKEGE